MNRTGVFFRNAAFTYLNIVPIVSILTERWSVFVFLELELFVAYILCSCSIRLILISYQALIKLHLMAFHHTFFRSSIYTYWWNFLFWGFSSIIVIDVTIFNCTLVIEGYLLRGVECGILRNLFCAIEMHIYYIDRILISITFLGN